MKDIIRHHNLVGVAEIAVMFGVSKQVVSNWRNRYPSFPAAHANLAMGSIFSKSEVERWGKSNGKLKG